MSWNFEKKGTFAFSKEEVTEDRLMEFVLEAGAEDLRDLESEYEVITDPQDFEKIKEKMEEADLKYALAEITMVPKTTVDLGEQQAVSMLKLMEKMEDNDDVQHVYANFNISDEIMEKLG